MLIADRFCHPGFVARVDLGLQRSDHIFVYLVSDQTMPRPDHQRR